MVDNRVIAGYGTLEVRLHKDAEWDDILDVDRLSFPKSEAWKPSDFGRAGTVQVALVDGQIMAYAAWRRSRGVLWLLRIAVLPQFRRRGIASLLIRQKTRKVHDWGCSGEGIVRCVVPEESLPAQLLFRSLGWIADGTAEGHFRFILRPEWCEVSRP